jgi:hypothetical protein
MLKALWKSGRKAKQVVDATAIVRERTFRVNNRRPMMVSKFPQPGTARSSTAFPSIHAREPIMKNSSERLVVFVTPAQKRAIATAAHELGISVSELLRRAVQAFDATADQVRAARIVDNWGTRQAPDALKETLRRIAGTAVPARPAASSPAALHACEPPARQPVPVAAAVARALELRGEERDAAASESARLDQQAVAQMTARWAAARKHDAGNAPAFEDIAPEPRARRARTGS